MIIHDYPIKPPLKSQPDNPIDIPILSGGLTVHPAVSTTKGWPSWETHQVNLILVLQVACALSMNIGPHKAKDSYVCILMYIYVYNIIHTHDGSMVLLYMVSWIPSIYPSHVSIYTIDGSYGICMCIYIYTHMGLSENSVPLHPMVNDHYPY